MGLNQSEECFFLVDPEFHNVQYRYSTNFATSIISGIFSPVAVTANFVVLYVIFRAAWLRDPSNLLLACLAACDMLIGVIVQPSYVSFRLSENRDHFVPCFVRIIYSTSKHAHSFLYPTAVPDAVSDAVFLRSFQRAHICKRLTTELSTISLSLGSQ